MIIFALRKRPGFTLMELMLAIGILGVLSSVVIIAINPTQQLEAAEHAKRKSMVREQENALLQYLISVGRDPITGIPVSEELAKPICRTGQTDESCISLATLNPDYLVSMPVDGFSSESLHTGYRVYKDAAQRPRVCSDYLPEGDERRCSASIYVLEEGFSSSSSETSSTSSSLACSGTPFEGGVGSPGNPYQICSCEQLQRIDGYLSEHFVLTANMNCTQNLTSIGDNNYPFLGTLDGQGHTISNMSITELNDDYVGLFGYLGLGATVTHVKFANANITAGNAAGIVAGWNLGTVSRVALESGTIAGQNFVGGLVGRNYGLISNSYAQYTTIQGAQYVGGIAGDCGSGPSSGMSVIENSYTLPALIQGNSIIGGICGQTGTSYGGNASIHYSFAVLNAFEGSDVGLIIGRHIAGDLINGHASGAAPCVAIEGGNSNCTIHENYSDFFSPANSPLSGWNFSDTWISSPGEGWYPSLR